MDWYWNEYACTCFYYGYCEQECDWANGFEYDPSTECACAESQSLNDALYPAGWTYNLIDQSVMASF